MPDPSGMYFHTLLLLLLGVKRKTMYTSIQESVARDFINKSKVTKRYVELITLSFSLIYIEKN